MAKTPNTNPKSLQRKEKKIQLTFPSYNYHPATLLTGSFEKIITSLQELKDITEAKNPGKYIRFELDYVQQFDDVDLNLYGVRLEDDEEFSKRLAKIAENRKGAISAAKVKKTKREAEDLKIYKRLKKKFENKKIDL